MTGTTAAHVDGLVGVLSDAHGNGPAFDRAITVLTGLGARFFYFLGDAVGYIPSTQVLASLRELGPRVACIRGNHEAMLLGGDIDARRDQVYQLARVRAALEPEDVRMVSGWAPSLRVKFGDRSALFVHGSPADPTEGYVYADTDLSVFAPSADIVFMGHSHHPFVRECAGVRYVNVGSCGLPRDDGRFGSAALFDPVLGEARVVRFDIVAETAQALDAGAPVHASVAAVAARRKDSIYGDIVC